MVRIHERLKAVLKRIRSQNELVYRRIKRKGLKGGKDGGGRNHMKAARGEKGSFHLLHPN